MDRPIEGFHQDEHGDWVAELSCGHGQHVRHKPPFWSRPWAVTADGRASKIGAPLPCVLCDRFEPPPDVVAYKRTPDFDATSVPAGLLRDHTTKRGVWARIEVLEGRVRYVVEPPLARDEILEPGRPGTVVPELPHRVAPEPGARFFVTFLRRP